MKDAAGGIEKGSIFSVGHNSVLLNYRSWFAMIAFCI